MPGIESGSGGSQINDPVLTKFVGGDKHKSDMTGAVMEVRKCTETRAIDSM